MDERPRLSRPKCAQDWEDRKDVIMELYEIKTLKETMKIMEEEHLFLATEKQYKTQLQKWDIDHKRIKPTEYKAMIRKKRQREEDGHTDVKFKLRGLEIDDAKIVRFQKRHRISEPEQVSDCPTPPDLRCTTPAPLPLPPSPGLRPFPWYDIYEKYLDLSMAGASTTQFSDVRSILRSLIAPFDNYEAQCRSVEVRNIQYIRECCQAWALTIEIWRLTLARQILHPQELLRFIVSEHLDGLKNRCISLSSVDATAQRFVLWAVSLTSTIRTVSGLRDEAISLMETILPLVEQDFDLNDAETWFYYNEILIELALCCAEDGHQDEAKDLLENKIKFPSSLRCGSRFGETTFRLYRRLLRKKREDALQFVRDLQNGLGGRSLRQEHHARLQEGSSQPEASEWGPFLTDRIEWDKI